jgi:hypothetical protein
MFQFFLATHLEHGMPGKDDEDPLATMRARIGEPWVSSVLTGTCMGQLTLARNQLPGRMYGGIRLSGELQPYI